MLKRKLIIYAVVIFVILLGYFPISSWLFKVECLEAQCVRWYLASGTSSPVTCPGGVRVGSSVQSAYVITRYVVLCEGP